MPLQACFSLRHCSENLSRLLLRVVPLLPSQCIRFRSSRCLLPLRTGCLEKNSFSTRRAEIQYQATLKLPLGYPRHINRSYHLESSSSNFEEDAEDTLTKENLSDTQSHSRNFLQENEPFIQELQLKFEASWLYPFERSQGWGDGLQDILHRYLKEVYPYVRSYQSKRSPVQYEDSLDRSLVEVFDDASLALLNSRSYSVLDIGLWAWILHDKSSEKTALKFFAAVSLHSNPAHAYKRIPTFVLLSLLHRPVITASALRYLIICVWDYFQIYPSLYSASTDLRENKKLVSSPVSSCKVWMSPSRKHGIYRTMSEATMMDFISSLLRHAQKTWPAAMVYISMMFTGHIHGDSPSNNNSHLSEVPGDVSARLGLLCNQMLYLLGSNSLQHPWRSILYHQEAQLHVLRWMNGFQPALTVTREGYRAMIFVQLLHRKTTQEREWAELKAKSWPPWKEDKLGIDVEKGIEMGISRAAEIMSRLQEAGYSMLRWEEVAKIYSGWDTDGSPTIQMRTRESVPYFPRSRRPAQSKSTPETRLLNYNARIWAARLRATRTLNEAWACFLSYKNDEANPSLSVYYALIEKLVLEEERVRNEKRREEKQIREEKGRLEDEDEGDWAEVDEGASHDDERFLEDGEGDSKNSGGWSVVHGVKSWDSSRVLAGDIMAVMPPPTSPRESVYLPTHPPTLAEFFDDMIKRGVKPSGRCLAFLLRRARFFTEGITYLESSTLSESVIRTLRCRENMSAEEIHESLRSIPNYIFAAYIYFISRFSSGVYLPSVNVLTLSALARLGNGEQTASEGSKLHGPVRIPHSIAFRLLLARNPPYRPGWYALLEALTRPKRLTQSGRIRYDKSIADHLVAWRIMMKLLVQMNLIDLELDFDGFAILCRGLGQAYLASRQLSTLLKRQEISIDSHEHKSYVLGDADPEVVRELSKFAERILWHRAVDLKALFWKISSSFETVRSSVKADPGSLGRNLVDREARARAEGLPRLLDIPSPVILHVYIRTLGITEDFGAIRRLCRWMADHASDIDSVANEQVSGRKNLRLVLTAVRVFLERSWLKYELGNEILDNDIRAISGKGASKSLLKDSRQIVQTMENWGGWPTDEEVKNYCRDNKLL